MRHLQTLTLVVALLATPLSCDRGTANGAEGAGQPVASGEAAGTGESEAVAGASDGPAGGSAPAGFLPATLRQEELRGVGIQALQQGDTDLAIAAFIALTETDEASDLRASAALILAELYHAEEESDRAVAILERLIATAPPMGEFEFVLGRTLGELERTREAEPHLRRAIELAPQLLQTYLYLGALLVADDRPDEAAEVYLAYETVLEQLIRALTSEATPNEQRLAIVEALSLANPDARITLALVGMLGEPHIVANAAAIQGLAGVGTPEAIEPLLAFAGLTDHQELALAAREAAARISQRGH